MHDLRKINKIALEHLSGLPVNQHQELPDELDR